MKKLYKDFINENWKIHKDDDSSNYMISNTNDDKQMTMMSSDTVDQLYDEINNLRNQVDSYVNGPDSEEEETLGSDAELLSANADVAKFLRHMPRLNKLVNKYGIEKYFMVIRGKQDLFTKCDAAEFVDAFGGPEAAELDEEDILDYLTNAGFRIISELEDGSYILFDGTEF